MSFTNRMKNKFFKNDELEKEIESLKSMNKKLKKRAVPYRNFDEYLIKTYNSPLMLAPFTKEEKHCLSFMENIAQFLISKAENSPEKPLVSVIMPIYNRKDVVMNAIDSVLNQTYENFELVVVDDASTDGTGDLLDKIDNPKVHVIHHEQNRYASGARNTAVKASKGEIIAYLDSDNLLDKRYLAATVGAFLHLSDADAIYSAQYKYTTYGSEIDSVQFAPFNKSLLHNHNFIDMNVFAHRRYVFDKIRGFDVTLKAADDWDLILQISNHYKIYSVPFLLSKCYSGIVENRVSDLVDSDSGKIRRQNEFIPINNLKLDKKVSIIIPVFESLHNLNKCLNTILSLNLDDIEIIVSNNNPDVDLQSESIDYDCIKVIESSNNIGFTHALVQGIDAADSTSDILILSQEAILTEGALENMQKKAYELSDCGLVVSPQLVENGSIIHKHIPYGLDDYWCDIAPSRYYRSILKIPVFHDGEIMELNQSPFFCTYLRREVYDSTPGFDLELGKHYHSFLLFSDYIRHILGLKIYHISNAIVFRNATDKFKNGNRIDEYSYKLKDNQWDLDEPIYDWDV